MTLKKVRETVMIFLFDGTFLMMIWFMLSSFCLHSDDTCHIFFTDVDWVISCGGNQKNTILGVFSMIDSDKNSDKKLFELIKLVGDFNKQCKALFIAITFVSASDRLC